MPSIATAPASASVLTACCAAPAVGKDARESTRSSDQSAIGSAVTLSAQPLSTMLRDRSLNDGGAGSNAYTRAPLPVAFAAISEYAPTFAPMS